MTFGAADMMNVPWETVVKIYAQKLGSRRFYTLEQYAKDFLTLLRAQARCFLLRIRRTTLGVSLGRLGLTYTETNYRKSSARTRGFPKAKSLRPLRKSSTATTSFG